MVINRYSPPSWHMPYNSALDRRGLLFSFHLCFSKPALRRHNSGLVWLLPALVGRTARSADGGRLSDPYFIISRAFSRRTLIHGRCHSFGHMGRTRLYGFLFTIRQMYTGGAFYGRFIWYESYDMVLVLVLGDTHFDWRFTIVEARMVLEVFEERQGESSRAELESNGLPFGTGESMRRGRLKLLNNTQNPNFFFCWYLGGLCPIT